MVFWGKILKQWKFHGRKCICTTRWRSRARSCMKFHESQNESFNMTHKIWLIFELARIWSELVFELRLGFNVGNDGDTSQSNCLIQATRDLFSALVWQSNLIPELWYHWKPGYHTYRERRLRAIIESKVIFEPRKWLFLAENWHFWSKIVFFIEISLFRLNKWSFSTKNLFLLTESGLYRSKIDLFWPKVDHFRLKIRHFWD